MIVSDLCVNPREKGFYSSKHYFNLQNYALCRISPYQQCRKIGTFDLGVFNWAYSIGRIQLGVFNWAYSIRPYNGFKGDGISPL